MPKITFKKAFFRIFWKILAKTGPQSLYLCGFPEASVEMEVAPFRALTQFSFLFHFKFLLVEMKVAPFRALTQNLRESGSRVPYTRRNEGRPFQGIDTLYMTHSCLYGSHSRNGGRPFQGIDTVFPLVFLSFLALVEMKVAPIRA